MVCSASLLVAAILLIVVGPLLVVRSAHDQAEQAALAVIHTSEVKAGAVADVRPAQPRIGHLAG